MTSLPTHTVESWKLNKFSWIRQGRLAAMGLPLHGASDTLKKLGLEAVLTLTEDPVPSLRKEMPNYYHHPLKDFGAPTVQDLEKCVDWIESNLNNHKSVVVHCLGGKGRTGTILASWLVASEGYSADNAIAEIRNFRPGSIETTEQEESVRLFAEHLGQN